jgi:hypothetical protein
MDAKTRNALLSHGIDPAKIPPGTLIGGKPIEEAVAVPPAPHGPNKTESAWISHLDFLVSAGRVKCYWYEPFRLRLTDPDPQTRRQTFSVPDFLVIMAPGVSDDPRPRVVEVKGGFVRLDASVKFRLTMQAYSPAFRFSMVQRSRGTWQTIAGEEWTE